MKPNQNEKNVVAELSVPMFLKMLEDKKIRLRILEDGAIQVINAPDLSSIIPADGLNDCQPSVSLDTLFKEITDLIHQLGIPAHIKGYNYIRSAILFYVREPSCSLTKELYPQIARQYNTTPSRVERAIRHAIEVACRRGNISEFENIFGYTLDPQKGKATNREFISMISDHLHTKHSTI